MGFNDGQSTITPKKLKHSNIIEQLYLLEQSVESLEELANRIEGNSSDSLLEVNDTEVSLAGFLNTTADRIDHIRGRINTVKSNIVEMLF